jgi:Histidine-specific methyltransferase, SAM-dependent
MPGITDWKLKQEAMRLLFEVHNVNDVVDKILGVEHDNYVRVYDQYSHRWKDHRAKSDTYGWFFHDLATQLGCLEAVPGDSLMFRSFRDFIGTLPTISKKQLKEAIAFKSGINHYEELKAVIDATAVAEPTKIDVASQQVRSPSREIRAPLPREDHEHYFPIWTPHKNAVRSIVHGLEDRNIDQSLYYQTTGSVARWFRITNSDYDIYHSCQLSLVKLVKSKVWESFVCRENFHGNIMLAGGGAPSKDTVLVKSLLRLKRAEKGKEVRVNHTLLDTSQFMLTASRRQLASDLRAEGWDGNVNLRTIQCDILNMRGTRALLHPRDKNAAWFMTGATLGNLDEDEFFASISKKAEKGDWLILGVACCGDNPTQDVLDVLLDEYRQESVRDFMINPLRAIWSELDLAGTAEATAAGDALIVKAVTGAENKFSRVPNSITVTIKIDVPRYDTVQLLQSTRYVPDNLIKFANRYDWKAVSGAEFDGAKADFKTIVFERL